jgi:crotonobetainyl-CoA:carnitine CoA-transferase CaiB-like acyl-CoA transferase
VGALHDLTVVDFSSMIAGPYCTRMLADLGADVIKVESPDGDHMRKLRPRKSGASRFFGQLNVGKRSVVADLTDADARAGVLALVAGGDVIVENWRPGVAARLGLAYDDCRRVREDIVYCSISGWGQTGPHAQRAAFAPNVHAASGVDMANLIYQPPGSVPPVTGVFVGDVLGGTMAFGAVLAALRRRDATGAGAHVDVSLIEAMLSMPIYELQAELAGLTGMRPSHRPVPASDGFIILTIVSDQNWRAVSRAIGRPELGTDPRYVDVRARTGHWDEIHDLVCAWAGSRTAGEAERLMLECGVPAAKYQTMASLLGDEHLRAREVFRPVADAAGEFLVTATPFRLDGEVTPAPGTRVPRHGADTDDVFAKLRGD